MLLMSKKSAAVPPREGTAAAIREAASGGTPPAPEEPKRRTFTAEYKLRILIEADAALASGETGAVGQLLRREGLYSSNLVRWRQERDEGLLEALTAKKRGRKSKKDPVAEENERLRRQVAKLEAELKKAEIVIEVQKKVAALLGETLPVPTEEDFARGKKR
jgi:transposase-like protein